MSVYLSQVVFILQQTFSKVTQTKNANYNIIEVLY